MKRTASLLVLIALLGSCKSGSFLHRRYTHYHVAHVCKTMAAPVAAKKTNRSSAVMKKTGSVKTMQAISRDTLPVQPSVRAGKMERVVRALVNTTGAKIKKSKKSGAAFRSNKKNDEQVHYSRKSKKNSARRNTDRQGGAGLAVLILLLGSLSGLLLSLLAYLMFTEVFGAALLALLAAPFVAFTLIALMAYYSAGYKKWIVLTYIGAALIIVPAVITYLCTLFAL
jgi:hypothetical protein